ncbi:hypothetical protein AN958_06380 [Leucoagaricus sp. SymC.cos]|nr:hypothetical protein AN958_06380 [Leucoagaricus sp. SymC.cos]
MLDTDQTSSFAPAEILNAVLATALFRCLHLILFFTTWSAVVTALNEKGFNVNIDSSLLTVIGTVLGFVISYRTTSSFERYNEGRRLWSQVILATRNFARNVWFHVPDPEFLDEPVVEPMDKSTDKAAEMDNIRARMLVEKKTVINLLGAFAVAVKHYLRGEDGIYYKDLYHSVKFLPAYALPAGRPEHHPYSKDSKESTLKKRIKTDEKPPRNNQIRQATMHGKHLTLPQADEGDVLAEARDPPKYHFLDLFPFSLFIPLLAKRGQSPKGKKAARLRARLQSMAVSYNLPLELSFYLSSYIAALQKRKVCDPPTITNLTAALNMLVDSLTGLERILTTPIPFSYAAHLWSVTTIYCLLLPIMVWPKLRWVTIPATAIIAFLFFGFLVAGEEIEDPFGYDMNDLVRANLTFSFRVLTSCRQNLDHFTNNIIRDELRAITSTPPPDVSIWAFAPENDSLLADHEGHKRITPSEWVKKGPEGILQALGDVKPSETPSVGRPETPSTLLGQPNLSTSPTSIPPETFRLSGSDSIQPDEK